MSDIMYIKNYIDIPTNILEQELNSYRAFTTDFEKVKRYYEIYHKGSIFVPTESKGDYVPSQISFKKAANLINKEARFMFAKTPEVKVSSTVDNAESSPQIKEEITIFQSLIDKVLKANDFGRNIIKAARDCFIGERVGIMLNFNEEDGITLTFLPALNFVYETSDNDCNCIEKFVAFVITDSEQDTASKRIFKKKYVMMKDGYCHVFETTYNGYGTVMSEETEIKTLFKYIPARVITNDGLLNDIFGQSEIELLNDYESLYSKISNADIDAERQSMNPIRYTTNASNASTKNLSIAPGSYWDLQPNINNGESTSVTAGVLETGMNYSGPLAETLKRISTIMHDTIDMPDISLESMQGIITSGKALKSIYWPLIVRCDEKMKAWQPALEFMCKTIIEGAKLYPMSASKYIVSNIPIMNNEYEISVENIYPISDEESEEKTLDIMEVNAQTMSKKAYMMKWRNLTSAQADEELKQIALERQTLEDSFTTPPMSYEDNMIEDETESNIEENIIDEEV